MSRDPPEGGLPWLGTLSAGSSSRGGGRSAFKPPPHLTQLNMRPPWVFQGVRPGLWKGSSMAQEIGEGGDYSVAPVAR